MKKPQSPATRQSTATPPNKRDRQSQSGISFFQAHDSLSHDEKYLVADQIVNKFLHEGDSILLDAGTSLYPIAEKIAEKATRNPASTHYTIMTHNYRAFQILVDKVPREANLNIVLAGGRYDQDLNALFGPQTIMAYNHFYPRVVLLGISGMVASLGLFCHGNTEELAVKEVIFSKGARDRIIVADHTKLGNPDSLCFGASQNLRAKVRHCIVVTGQPKSDADKMTREVFESELETLRNTYNVQVENVNEAGR